MTNNSGGRKIINRPQSDTQDLRDNVTEYSQNIRIFRFCAIGVGGGGDCIAPTGSEYVIWPFRVSKFITHISKVTFHNPELTGLQFFTDAGVLGLCPYSLGTEQDFYIGLAATDSLDPETTAKAGTVLNGLPPYDIEFPTNKCPQPTEVGWDSIIYVYVWWGDSTFINAGGAFFDLTKPSIELVKMDNEMSI